MGASCKPLAIAIGSMTTGSLLSEPPRHGIRVRCPPPFATCIERANRTKPGEPMLDHLATASNTETARQQERKRLVKLCARITGDASVAEDLAHEALLEGWRHQHSLRESGHLSAWLSGVARHVSLRWLRHHSREWWRI